MNLAEEMAKEVEAGIKEKIELDIKNLYENIRKKAKDGIESIDFMFYSCFSPHDMNMIIKGLTEQGFDVKCRDTHYLNINWGRYVKKSCPQCGENHNEVCQ